MHNRFCVILFALLGLGCQAPPARHVATLSDYPPAVHEAARRENAAAVTLVDGGQLDAAETHLLKAIAADAGFAAAHNNLGHVYFHQSRLVLAVREFHRAAELLPAHPEPRNNLGLVYEAAGKLDEAVDCYQQAWKLDSVRAEYLGNLARARVRRGDPAGEVLPLLTRIAQTDPRRDWAKWAQEMIAKRPVNAPAP